MSGTSLSWITLYPEWFLHELETLADHYPNFSVDEKELAQNRLVLYGEVVVRPSGGPRRHALALVYPASTPATPPSVRPLEKLPERNEQGHPVTTPQIRWFDRRHQMPTGGLCLFQQEPRGSIGGERIRGIDVLRRASQWFVGYHTGHWPPDTAESELEAHFEYAGELLLSRLFFGPEVDGRGQFFMARDLRRLFLDRTAVPPLVATAATEESSGIVKYIDARGDLGAVFPWVRDEAWNPEKLLLDEPTRKDLLEGRNSFLEKGYWWSLPREPQPFRNGEGLLRVLSEIAPDGDSWTLVSTALKGDFYAEPHLFFALRYPGRQGGVEWLGLFMPREQRGNSSGGVALQPEQEKKADFEQSAIACLRMSSVRDSDLRLRNTGVVAPAISERTVALIGLGALGSSVAELLVKAGVGHVRLCDLDRLAVGNVARHVGGVTDFGAMKTRVVASRLLEINPYLMFNEDDLALRSATADLDWLSSFLSSADLAISTVADENAETVINQVAVLAGTAALYGRALRRGSMGRVFLVRPGTEACKSCLGLLASAYREGQAPNDDWIEIPERPEDAILHECGRPVIPASAVDLSFVAGLISRVALDVLEGRDPKANHWIWTREPEVDVDQRLDRGMTTFESRLDQQTNCPACQEPDIQEVIFSAEAEKAICTEAESSPDRETGGVLIGFVDPARRAIVLKATGPGSEAKQSRSLFSRDVAFVQEQLDRAARELGNKGLYLGEWHSHLEAEPSPSALDLQSMLGITGASNYFTRCPVMAIAGLDPDQDKVRAVRTWTFRLNGRVFSLENRVAPNDEAEALKMEKAAD